MAPPADFFNFRTCCRLCLTDHCAMTNIFAAKSQPAELIEKIYSVIGIKVTSQDNITTNLCDKCFLYVNNYNNFKNECLINQVKLAEQLSVFEHSLINDSVLIKDEPLSDDDDVVYVADHQDLGTPLIVKTESLNTSGSQEYDDGPPILSPHLPTAEMLKNLEVHTIEQVDCDVENSVETIETIESAAVEVLPDSVAPAVETLAVAVAVAPAAGPTAVAAGTEVDKEFRVPELPTRRSGSGTGLTNDSRDKIDFAAGLNLAKKMDNINMEPFTPTEIQYHKRMQIIYAQKLSNRCACHNDLKFSYKAMVAHLRKCDGVVLPPFTCAHCCTTFSRSGFAKHRYTSCEERPYANMYMTGNAVERGINKHRNYQSFKCTLCEGSMRVFEAYEAHLGEHSKGAPRACKCGREFGSAASFRQHMLTACVMKPSCDMCDVMFDSADEFKAHCRQEHDDKEGETFTVEASFDLPELPFVPLYACVECNLKCRQELFLVGHLQQEHGYDLPAAKRVGVDCYIGPQNGVDLDHVEHVEHAQIAPTAQHGEPENNNDELPLLVRMATPPRGGKQKKGIIDADEAFMATSYRLLPKTSMYECRICYKHFSNIPNVRRHVKQAHLSGRYNQHRLSMFSCGNCNTSFQAMADLQNHLMSAHLNTCKECGKKCESADELDKHRSSHLKISLTRDPKTQSYRSSSGGPEAEMPVLQSMDSQDIKALQIQCTECQRRFATPRGLTIHIKRKHEAALRRETLHAFPQLCRRKGCHVLLKSHTDWSLHMQLHAEGEAASSDSNSPAHPDDTDYFTCNKCFKVFVNRGNLKQHMRTHGVLPSPKAKRYFCSICRHVSESQGEWAKHKQSHAPTQPAPAGGQKRVYCKYCKVAFADEHFLNAHMRDEHAIDERKPKEESLPKSKHECKICGKMMASPDSLRVHLTWHKRRAPLQPSLASEDCEAKPKVTPPAKLSINTSKLFKNKTFICITCGELFPSTTALTSHQMAKHGRLRCPTCWQYFERAAELTEHVRTMHVKAEPLAMSKKRKKSYEYCKICGEEFGAEDELREHMEDAHPEVPYLQKGASVCPICDDSFRNMAALSSHLRMHKRRGETAISVAKTSANNANAHVNRAAHKFNCGICSQGYDLGPDLRKHILDEHPF